MSDKDIIELIEVLDPTEEGNVSGLKFSPFPKDRDLRAAEIEPKDEEGY